MYLLTAPPSFRQALAFVLIFYFVPETKGLTLEELDFVFSVPHKTFIHHQHTKVVPYFVKHTVLRQKAERPADLVHFDREVYQGRNSDGEKAA